MKTVLIIKTGGTFPWMAERYGDFEDMVIRGMGLPRERFVVVSLSVRLPAGGG